MMPKKGLGERSPGRRANLLVFLVFPASGLSLFINVFVFFSLLERSTRRQLKNELDKWLLFFFLCL